MESELVLRAYLDWVVVIQVLVRGGGHAPHFTGESNGQSKLKPPQAARPPG